MACRPAIAALVVAALLVAGCGGGHHTAARGRADPPQLTIDGPRLSRVLAEQGELADIPGVVAAIAVDRRLGGVRAGRGERAAPPGGGGGIAGDGGRGGPWAWGGAALARPRPMRPTTPVAFMSISKPLTPGVALRLVDEGRVRLDEPVSRW